jgi:hypothetical protein
MDDTTTPVRIVSDGTIATTRVYVGDIQMLNVVGIRWELDGNHRGRARAWLEVTDVHIDVATNQADTVIYPQEPGC